MVQPHQPGQAVFRSILPEDIDWKPFPAFPPSVRLAVLVGQPSEPGPYLIRVKVPAGAKLMPHKHPEDRIYTVMSDVFYIGLGERLMPARSRHIHPAALSFCPAIPGTSIGRSPASTSPRLQPSDPWASNTWMQKMIHGVLFGETKSSPDESLST